MNRRSVLSAALGAVASLVVPRSARAEALASYRRHRNRLGPPAASRFTAARWVEIHHFDRLPNSYAAGLQELHRHVNAEPFRGYEPGEVLFLGAWGDRLAGGWRVRYRFAAAANRRGFEYAGIVYDKRGWECAYFQRGEASVQRIIVTAPCPPADFGRLLIGSWRQAEAVELIEPLHFLLSSPPAVRS
jgi:hypothetical protein